MEIAKTLPTQVSTLSHLRAANGETRLSSETQQAISNGATAPTIANRVEEPKDSQKSDNDSRNIREVSDFGKELASTGSIEGVGGDPAIAAAAQNLNSEGSAGLLNILV